MRLSRQWKIGMVILFRLIFLGMMLFFFTAPLMLLELLPESFALIGIVVTLIYYLTVVPIVLPALLEISGFKLRSSEKPDNAATAGTEQAHTE